MNNKNQNLITLTEEQLEKLFREIALAVSTNKCPTHSWLNINECLRDVWSSVSKHPVYGSNPFHSNYYKLTTCGVCHARSLFLEVGIPLPKILPEILRTKPETGK